jgi:hypothetical protein
MSCSTCPDVRCDKKHSSQKKQMPLAPYPRRWDKQHACNTNSQQVVPRKQCNAPEGCVELPNRKEHRIRCKDGTEGCCKDGIQGEDTEDGIALPEGPVLTIVRMLV